ncbi:MAG: YraN family protein [Actinomyces dentalis]
MSPERPARGRTAGPAAPAGARRPPAGRGESAAQRRRETGRLGERITARYLVDCGWRVLERNWRPGAGLRGELDLVALDPTTGAPGPALVCVEVKTRASRPAAPPAAAVTAAKLARLRALTCAWAASHEVVHCGLRIDVVSIVLRPGLPAVLRHHRGVGL